MNHRKCERQHRKTIWTLGKCRLALALSAFMCLVLSANALAAGDASMNNAYSKLGYAISDPVVTGNIISINAITAQGQVALTSKTLEESEIYLLTDKNSGLRVTSGAFIDICYNSAGEVIRFKKLFSLNASTWFDTIKYGQELSPVNGEAGQLMAAGWILDKTSNTIVVGDTNSFEETYLLNNGLKVYELNTSTKQIAAKNLADVPVTQKTNGKYSLTKNRQMVVVVFDKNYKQANSAQAIEIYYITPQTSVADKHLLSTYETMSLYSPFPDADYIMNDPRSSGSWTGYTKPFAIVPERLYFLGDFDTANYLLKTDTGLAMLDFGNPGRAYQYYLAIEKLGMDPRDVKYLLISHGHYDHYAAFLEFYQMLCNAGRDPVVYSTKEEVEGYAAYGFPDIGGTLTETAIISTIDKYYEWEKWMDFGGIRIYPMITPGHTVGTGTFLFEVTPKVQQTKPIIFGYMGGIGTVANPSSGFLRNAYVASLRYLQQNVNVDYNLPQHNAHYPMNEIHKASELAHIPFLDAMNRGFEGWYNFMERRQECQVYEEYAVKFKADPRISVTYPDGTVKVMNVQTATPGRVTMEAAGPWKREGGQYTITLVDGGKLLHGFDILENPNPLLNGIYTNEGANLGLGFTVTRDGYVHDPDKWFLQISMHVQDGYTGNITTGQKNGPVESIRGAGWYEINRTKPFNSKAEAEAVLATLKAGTTYTVTMDKNSDILLSANIMDTFKKVQ